MIITIDGPAGAGKSTVARAVAARLRFNYVEAGALYRCVALLQLRDKPDDDADILNRVMRIDLQIALRFNREIDQAVPRQQIEHVIEKPHAGLDRRCALAVQIECDADFGFLGLSGDVGSTWHKCVKHQ